MFIIGGVLAIPIALFGFLTFPGTPEHPTRYLFSDKELALSRVRMRGVGRKPNSSVAFRLSSIKRFLGRWHFWVLVPWSIIFQQGYLTMAQNTYILWIKSNGQYSTFDVNNLTAVPPSVGIVFIIFFAFMADKFGARSRIPLFAIAHIVMGLGHIAFVAYAQSPFAYKWYAIAVSNVENAIVPVQYSWANLICADDAEERAFVLASMLAFAMAFNSWVPLVSLPTVQSPKFFKGYLTALIMQPLAFALAVLVYYLHNKQQKQRTSDVKTDLHPENESKSQEVEEL
jgi:hypothetical protein